MNLTIELFITCDQYQYEIRIQRLIGNLKFKMCTALFETKISQTNSYFKNKQNSD